ncbi:MAG: Endo-1,4-beta-xylanase A precursor [Firmicutes bacterium ADurb.Bin456]|nr:MAG: Endo-1,4-beta-xylanase A precursor [Firmicutes bacterium ADurb.Bin456]
MKKQDMKLNPAEEVAVDELKNLLPREKALEKARTAVEIPEGYTLSSSRLEQDYMFKQNKNWNFNWQPADKASGGLSVTIDAIKGDLVAFNLYENIYGDYTKREVKYSEAEARRMAEEFIKKNHPGRWGQVLFESLQPIPGPVLNPQEEPVTSFYAIKYDRIVNNVKFPANGFEVNVNSSTGKVTLFQMNWWDLDFPDPRGVLSRETAAHKYLEEAPLKLGYLRLWPREMYWPKPDQEAKIHLVYYQASLNFEMLDAFTGQALNSEGNPVSPDGKKIEFGDLEGHPAREAVELLAAAGIVGQDDGKFRPDEAVTQAELIAMLVRSFDQSTGLVPRGKEPWYQIYFEQAARIGIIQAGEKPDPGAPVNRETLARYIIHALDLYKVARFSDIYVLDFEDAADITGHLKGHAVLSAALGLIKPAEGKFEPRKVVSRAEAAETVVRFLQNN